MCQQKYLEYDSHICVYTCAVLRLNIYILFFVHLGIEKLVVLS